MAPSVSSSQDKQQEALKITLENLINDIAKKEKRLNDEKIKCSKLELYFNKIQN
jgi:hypothetical protein